MKPIKAILIFLLILNANSFSQSDSLLQILNDLSENESYLNELILELRENPVNINSADIERLMDLPLMTHTMAEQIIKVRKEKSTFKNRRQIRKIVGLELYSLIKDLITIKDKKITSLKLIQRNTYKIERLPKIKSSIYTGDALYSYSRFYYKYNRYWDAGFIMQKDPGESEY
jgi:hypothetical protein